LSLFRQRSQEALRQMARRGALVLGVAADYVKVGRDRTWLLMDKQLAVDGGYLLAVVANVLLRSAIGGTSSRLFSLYRALSLNR
jgi:hypothetical protein